MRLIFFAVLCVSGCGSSSAHDPMPAPAEETSAGANEDPTTDSGDSSPSDPPVSVNGGSAQNADSACPDETLIPFTETSILGFSPQQVLDLIEGDYSVPIALVDPCGADYPCWRLRDGVACTRQEREIMMTAETVLSVGIHHTSSSARVRFSDQTGSDPEACGDMWIPALFTLQSEDGALDEEFEVEIHTYNGNYVEIFMDEVPSTDLQGSFAETLPETSTLQLSFGADGDRFFQRIYIGNEGGFIESPFLISSLLPVDECAADVAREDVLDVADQSSP